MNPRGVTQGLRRLFNPQAADRDLDDEIAQYIAAAADEYARSGMSRADAERRARVEFGGVEAAKEDVRAFGWDGMLASVRRDVAFGLRGMRRNLAFTAVAVITIALGVGANTAMFGIVNAVIIRPLAFPSDQQLVQIWTDDARRGLHQEATAYRTIEDWRAETRSFQSIAYFNTTRTTLADAPRERTRTANVSANLFATLGISALLGRTLRPDDESQAAPVAVIAHSLWVRRFKGDSAVLGKTLQFEGGGKGGGLFTIVGVVPDSFRFPNAQHEIYVPSTTYWRFQRESSERSAEWARRWSAIGRLRADVSIDEARLDLARVGAHLQTAYPSSEPDFPGFRTTVMSLRDSVNGSEVQKALWLLLGAVSLVLVMACANVANLLLARGSSRQQEFAIRRSLGAGRGAVIRQLMVESMVLALVGGAIGVMLGAASIRLASVAASARIPRLAGAALDTGVLLFALAASVAAGLVFGILPAARMTTSLGQGARNTDGVAPRRARGLLVLAECALAVVLLAGAGLVLRSLYRIRTIDPGFDATKVLVVRIEFPPDALIDQSGVANDEVAMATRRGQLAANLVPAVQGLPGVEDVSFVDDMFTAGHPNGSITIPGRRELSTVSGELNSVAASPGFFRTVRVPLRRGRFLTDDDLRAKIMTLYGPLAMTGTLAEREARAKFEPVVVNEAFVHRYFPTDNPLGKHFCTDPTNKTYWYTIVGVVGDMRRQGQAKEAIPEFYGAYVPTPNGRFDLLVRTRTSPAAYASTIRGAIERALPGALIPTISTAESQLGDFNAQRDFQARLLGIFAMLALVLAATGIYGVVHYAVAERTREVGVRVALGATPSAVMALVIRQGMATPLAGIVVGIVASLGATRLLAGVLYGISPMDPLTFGGVAVTLAGVALLACMFPAVRATRVDPVAALRRE